ncbi:hypothetical protein BD626DRAFT_479534 [Schizophyllum amplum]|uniref:MYND-type domain-containing protein n=1 Tax=Schizophyllum amplum TaxID=97359 RepID=A0A550CSC1_9AGAR|nr:hypothetical protein BD626DRAFT_479534 [Auriculariopsis ampla]
MAHSVIIPRRTFFYPVGNTSADLLTEGLPPEENLDLLLIGCGDPRSILYTVYADRAADRREFDITFCDIEPAVIARNVLLFTLVADTSKEHDDAIWDIFYHFRFSRSSLALLQEQSAKLVSASESLRQWLESPYAIFIRPRTEQTLSDIRRFWAKYAATASFTDAQHSSMRSTVSAGVDILAKRQGDNMQTGCRSAGALWMDMLRDNKASAHAKHYWRTGVVAGSPVDAASIEFVNPTFVYTGLGSAFCLHYGTDPILGFHLAGILAPVRGNPATVGIEDIGRFIKQEFGKWINIFRTRVSSNIKFIVRPYVGDALFLCRALAGEPNQCVSAWDARPIILQETTASHAAPNTFNTIETSNIADHVGLLSVLSVGIPLLRQSPTSILHTSSLLTSSGKTGDALLDRIGVDSKTFSALLGIAPLALLAKCTTRTSPFDNYPSATSISSVKQYHQLIAWKYASSGDQAALIDGNVVWKPIAVDAVPLCELLFKLYLHMFSCEDVSKTLASLNLKSLPESHIIIYVRASFAALLKLVKARVSTDWKRSMDMLFDRIEGERSLLMGMNFYQDLCTQACILDVCTRNFLSPTFVSPLPVHPIIFARWTDTPPVAHVVMRIPRSAFQKLERLTTEKVGTPMLQCEILVRKSGLQNIYSSIQLAFGELAVEGDADAAQAIIDQDEEGWQGNSPVILIIRASTRLLELSPHSTLIRLALRSTAQTMSLSPVLGMELVIFAAELMGDGVHILRNAPRIRGVSPPQSTSLLRQNTYTASSSSSSHSLKHAPYLIFTGEIATHMSVRLDIRSDKGKRALKEGGAKAQQHTACTMEVFLGSKDQTKDVVPFSFPIDGKDVKLKVARTSGYVEVIVRIASADPSTTQGGYPQTMRTPVVLSRGSPCVWNLNYVNLDKLPALDLPQPKSKLDWVQPLATMAFSDRELRLQRAGDESDTFVNLKNSIAHIMSHASGAPDGQVWPVFSLYRENGIGGYTLIFVNAVRLDLVSHSIVLDVCILPLTPSIMPKVEPIISKLLGNDRRIRNNITNDEEIKAWKALLPASVERCRTWSHEADCLYLRKGVPLALGVVESPICDCGRGKDIPNSETMKKYKQAVPLVTRAAISLLFAVPYLEDVGKMLEAALNEASSAKCAACGTSSGKLLTCSRCKMTKYCSQACQKGDWKAHKKVCNV